MGLRSTGNTVTVKDTVFLGNEDNFAVEGNSNIVTVTNSTSTLAREDGVEIDGNDNTVTVKDTTISNNGVSDNPNDGLDVDGARNVLQIGQVTFSANGEDGLDIEGPNNHIFVTHSTITGNGRDGILNQDPTSTSTVVVYNSITAGNTGPDAVGNFSSAGYNLVGNGTGSTGFDGPGDQVGTSSDPIDARFIRLQDNGGSTFTHDLLSDSPAINAGDPNFTPPPDFDQRGPSIPRVQDGTIDIGALEAPPRPPPVPVPEGPDLEPEIVQCRLPVPGSSDVLHFIVTNKGTQEAGPSTASVSCQKFVNGEPIGGVGFPQSRPIPPINPGDRSEPVEVGIYHLNALVAPERTSATLPLT